MKRPLLVVVGLLFSCSGRCALWRRSEAPAAGGGSAAAQLRPAAEEEVNLAALGVARLALSDPACARYALHLVGPEGLLKGPHDDLVRVSFEEPVRVTAVQLRVRGGPARHLSVSADILGADGMQWSSGGSVGEGTLVLRPAVPIAAATQVTLRLTGGHLKPMHLEVLGTVSGSADAGSGPSVDEAGCAELAEQVRGSRAQDLEADMQEVRAHAARMHALDAALQAQTDAHARAWAWLELNHEADNFAGMVSSILGRVEWEAGLEAVNRILSSVQEMVGELPIDVHYCDSDGNYTASDLGYRKYMELWPDGPDVDEAAFWSIDPTGPRCVEAELDDAALERLQQAYERFLNRFPHSVRVGDARKALAALQAPPAEESESTAEIQQEGEAEPQPGDGGPAVPTNGGTAQEVPAHPDGGTTPGPTDGG